MFSSFFNIFFVDKASPTPVFVTNSDQNSKCSYYVCSETGESRWASSNDDEWMEATDPVTG
jgi:hypothetical protein